MSASSLMVELLEEIFLRLPPEDPAYLVRASVVCKRWRHLLAGRVFRRRYRELHGRTQLLGFLLVLRGDEPYNSRSVPAGPEPDLRNCLVVDCRHGRALLARTNPDTEGTMDLVVWEPMTGDHRRVPQPSQDPEVYKGYTAAVLCATEGCRHYGCECEGDHFRVAFVSTGRENTTTSARLYSSETGTWNKLIFVHHPSANVNSAASILVGDTLHFRGVENLTFEYQLGATPRLSVHQAPAMESGGLITGEDGGLGFAAVDGTRLTLWSRETDPRGVEAWTQRRAIDLETLLPCHEFVDSPSRLLRTWIPDAFVMGFAEGTNLLFLGTLDSVYMIELKTARAEEVLLPRIPRVYPYTSFYIPAIKAVSPAEGSNGGV